jgi:hypothetical protein
MDCTKDFENAFIDKYSVREQVIVEGLILECLENNLPMVTSTVGDWYASSSIEKHDALNHTYFIDLVNDEIEDELVLTFYTGIDVGCEMVEYSFEGDTSQYGPKFIEALVDIEVDYDEYPEDITDFKKRKLDIFLKGSKEDILDIYSKMDYDNYHTGGGTLCTDNFYKEQLDSYKDRGFFFKLVYDSVEVDRNMI